jgi:hypothetical protein
MAGESEVTAMVIQMPVNMVKGGIELIELLWRLFKLGGDVAQPLAEFGADTLRSGADAFQDGVDFVTEKIEKRFGAKDSAGIVDIAKLPEGEIGQYLLSKNAISTLAHQKFISQDKALSLLDQKCKEADIPFTVTQGADGMVRFNFVVADESKFLAIVEDIYGNLGTIEEPVKRNQDGSYPNEFNYKGYDWAREPKIPGETGPDKYRAHTDHGYMSIWESDGKLAGEMYDFDGQLTGKFEADLMDETEPLEEACFHMVGVYNNTYVYAKAEGLYEDEEMAGFERDLKEKENFKEEGKRKQQGSSETRSPKPSSGSRDPEELIRRAKKVMPHLNKDADQGQTQGQTQTQAAAPAPKGPTRTR